VINAFGVEQGAALSSDVESGLYYNHADAKRQWQAPASEFGKA